MALLTNINGKFSVDTDGAASFNRIGASETTGFTFPSADGANGEVLKTNGLGTVSWLPDSNTGTVTGTGAANRVAYWTTASNISYNDDFKYTGANKIALGGDIQTTLADFSTIEIGNIGMIMSEKADSQYNSMFVSSNAYYASGWKRKTATVDGSTYISMYLGGIRFGTTPQGAADSAITWTNQLIIANNGDSTFAGNVTTGGQVTVPAGYSVNIGTSRIHSTATSYLLGGNVGIGTTSPATELQIGDYTDAAETITIATSGDGTGRINFYDANNTEGGSIRVTGKNLGSTMYFANRWNTDSDKITFDLANGNVGIGTVTPGTKLEIKNPDTSGSAARTVVTRQLTLNANGGNNLQPYEGFGTGIIFEGYDYAGGGGTSGPRDYAYIDSIIENSGSTPVDFRSQLKFYTNPGGSNTQTPTPKMVIEGGGNVGIGTDAPGAKLEVRSDAANPDYGVYFYNSGGGRVLKIYNTDWDAGDNLIYASNGGTASIGYEYILTGNAKIHLTSSDAYQEMAGGNGTPGTDSMLFGQNSTKVGYVWNRSTAATADILFGTSATTRMQITSAGQIHFPRTGQPPITNALYGNIVLDSNAVTNFQRIRFDVGTTAYWGLTRLNTGNFAITGGSTWNDHAFELQYATQHVQINETIGQRRLNVYDATDAWIRLYCGSVADWIFGSNGSDHAFKWYNQSTNGGAGYKMQIETSGTLTVSADVVAYGSPSDIRLKENIKPIESALDKVSKLQGVTFDWKESDSILDIKEDIGFIAQDVQKVIPELVRENVDGMLSMRHQGIAPILLEAIKELKAEIEELKLNKCNCKCSK